MSLVVGLVLEVAGCLAMTLGFVGVAEHVGGLSRLALAARGSLVSRGGPIVRSALSGAQIAVVGSHMEQSSAGGVESLGVAAFFIPGCTAGVQAEGVYARVLAILELGRESPYSMTEFAAAATPTAPRTRGFE